jgi:hypothetical protein
MMPPMVRLARMLTGLGLLSLAVGCGGSGVHYGKPSVTFDAAADATASADPDASADTAADIRAGSDIAPEVLAFDDGPIDQGAGEQETIGADAGVDLGGTGSDDGGGDDRMLCPTDVSVTIYCTGGNVYEHAPLIDCIGGRVYGICPHGCARDSVEGPLADPLAALCSAGAEAPDASADGGLANDAEAGGGV